MCGLWALFGYERKMPEVICHALKISHRGPDSFRIETIPHFNHCFMAFHRLSIMDDTNGQQPLRIQQLPHLYLMYNGEIYNHKSLIQKFNFQCQTGLDGEVILHLYNKFGIKQTLEQLDGVFALCIVDTKTNTVHIGRDTFGVKPLFTARYSSGELHICSEVKGLVDINKEKPDLEFIHPFKPGTYASFHIARDTGFTRLFTEEAFTDVNIRPKFDINVTLRSNVKENVRKLFFDAVDKRLMSERRIGCLLSGGLDSSLVTAVLTKICEYREMEYPIQTFSVGFDGSPDLKYARLVAGMLQTEHHEIVVTFEEAFEAMREVIYAIECYDAGIVRGSIVSYLLAKYIKEKTDTTVVLSGEGADELTQGYIHFHRAPDAKEGHEESKKLLRQLYLFDILRADRITSAHGLELRVPFLDKAFSAYYLSIDKSLAQPKNGVEKFLLRSAFDGQLKGYLPDEVLWRRKEALSDGVSKLEDTWADHLKRFAESMYTIEELANAEKEFPVNTPTTLEQLMYRKIFDEFFPGHCHLTPYKWKYVWVPNSNDPSARSLDFYTQ